MRDNGPSCGAGILPTEARAGSPRHMGICVAKEKEEDGIRVEIYDQAYHMRGQLDPAYIRQLAQFVDGKMRSIATRTKTVDSLRVAVLAALNIADECHQLRAKCETATRQVEQVDERISECSEALDELLH
ncbi:MAG TPA: cell division protein ZapA [Terriglobia bacterium]|nr:cell division protein ZapA [Terriglobia bacterium]